jgi:hypothetical protein
MYKHLGLDFERAEDNNLRLIFTQLDQQNPAREFFFSVHIDENERYLVQVGKEPYTHTHIHTYTHTHIDENERYLVQVGKQTHTHTHIHTYTHTHTDSNHMKKRLIRGPPPEEIYTHLPTASPPHTHTYIHTNTHTHPPTHPPTPSPKHTHTYIQTHTHTHTHTQECSPPLAGEVVEGLVEEVNRTNDFSVFVKKMRRAFKATVKSN